MNDTLCSVTADYAWYSRIWICTSFTNHPAQIVTALCLNYNIHIDTCNKARTKCNSKWCHVFVSSEITLCKNRINYYFRLHRSNAFALWINHYWYFFVFPCIKHLLFIFYTDCLHTFHTGTFAINCLT